MVVVAAVIALRGIFPKPTREVGAVVEVGAFCDDSGVMVIAAVIVIRGVFP